MNKQEALQQCTIEGNVVKLPAGQLDRKLYQDVAKSLELIGGKWKGGKVFGFVFPSDPSELLEQIANGENRNLKKEFQFFGTPEGLAREMVGYAEINSPNLMVLEPSAGQGAIIKAILNHEPGLIVHAFELMDTNRMILSKIKDCVILGEDFLTYNHFTQFDRIIANPPFSKNQDIDHIYKMYEVLKPGGVLVTIASKHWLLSSNKKETDFKNWLYNEVEADINGINAGAFSESGTKVETVMIIIKKQ
jgi:phospholipid N-methyltransferase